MCGLRLREGDRGLWGTIVSGVEKVGVGYVCEGRTGHMQRCPPQLICHDAVLNESWGRSPMNITL